MCGYLIDSTCFYPKIKDYSKLYIIQILNQILLKSVLCIKKNSQSFYKTILNHKIIVILRTYFYERRNSSPRFFS